MKAFGTAVLVFLCAVAALAAPAKIRRHTFSGGIPEQFIVVLARHVQPNAVPGLARSLGKAYNVEVLTVWEYAPRGFLCKATDEQIEAMATDPRVFFIEQDFITKQPDIAATQWTCWDPVDGDCSDDPNNPNDWAFGMWHLDRVDELSYANSDGQHNMCTEVRFPPTLVQS